MYFQFHCEKYMESGQMVKLKYIYIYIYHIGDMAQTGKKELQFWYMLARSQ